MPSLLWFYSVLRFIALVHCVAIIGRNDKPRPIWNTPALALDRVTQTPKFVQCQLLPPTCAACQPSGQQLRTTCKFMPVKVRLSFVFHRFFHLSIKNCINAPPHLDEKSRADTGDGLRAWRDVAHHLQGTTIEAYLHILFRLRTHLLLQSHGFGKWVKSLLINFPSHVPISLSLSIASPLR